MSSKVLTISKLVQYVKQELDFNPNLQNILVKGEISNFTNHRSGHWYFTLKDEKARMSCVMFAGNARLVRVVPKEGMKVILTASLSMYEASGSVQLYVKELQVDGLGDLFLEYEELKQRLAKEGLFEKSHKKELPIYPMRIGVLSARTGAAIQDVLTTIARRWGLTDVTVYPTLVQGVQASKNIIENLAIADKANHDIILLVRGGGSIEDLWCFNSEELARFIYQMETPIVSGVGHESDTTLVDYVSDARAATPTAAAELITPDIINEKENIYAYRRRIRQLIETRLQHDRKQLDHTKNHPYLKDPMKYVQSNMLGLSNVVTRLQVVEKRIQKDRYRMNELQANLQKAVREYQAQKRQRMTLTAKELDNQVHLRMQKETLQFQKRVQLLDAYSPLKILSRGYQITYKNEHIVHSIAQVDVKDDLRIRMEDGFVDVEVTNKEELS